MTHMRYVGSKARFRKELLPIILADRDPDQHYVEPFAGGFNLICHVDGPRIGNDIDSDVVACMKAISEGWDPPTELSEQEYSEIRSDPGAYPQHLVGFVSVGCSYSGKKWGGTPGETVPTVPLVTIVANLDAMSFHKPQDLLV